MDGGGLIGAYVKAAALLTQRPRGRNLLSTSSQIEVPLVFALVDPFFMLECIRSLCIKGSKGVTALHKT